MKAKLIIGNKNYSSWSLRSWLLLKKLEYEFEEIVVPLYQDGYHERLKRYCEPALVPIFIVNGITIWDSMAIAEYLAESHQELWPQDRARRSHARSVCAEMHSGFITLRNALPMNCRAQNRKFIESEALTNDIQRIDSIWTQCRTELGNDSAVNDPWLYGKFSIADAMFAPVVSRFRTYAIEGVSEFSSNYIDAVLDDRHMCQWYEQAAKEPWTIAASETG